MPVDPPAIEVRGGGVKGQYDLCELRCVVVSHSPSRSMGYRYVWTFVPRGGIASAMPSDVIARDGLLRYELSLYAIVIYRIVLNLIDRGDNY